MAKRPELIKGDLVKMTKRGAIVFNICPDAMWRVDRIMFPREQYIKLGRPHRLSSESWAMIHLRNEAGQTMQAERRYLWRVPNQPRYKVPARSELPPYHGSSFSSRGFDQPPPDRGFVRSDHKYLPPPPPPRYTPPSFSTPLPRPMSTPWYLK